MRLNFDKRNFIILSGGLVIILIAFISFNMLRGNKSTEVADESIPELPVDQRPFTSLVPTEDGHYLNLVVEGINVPGAALMEYELFYGTAEGINQGIPGRVTLPKDSIDRELLLGSESSGNFRYDEGVDDGRLTLKFRDVDGKFIGKVVTTWMLYSGTDKLASFDNNFTYTLDEVSNEFFIVMDTFGLPSKYNGEVTSGPYGIFSSSNDEHSGDLNSEFSRFDGIEWLPASNSSDDIGVFVK